MRAFSKQPSSHQWMRRCLIGCSITATAVFVMAASASAQVIVVQSSAVKLKPGSTISNDEMITIPTGKTALFVLPSGATRKVSGPFKGKASELTKGIKANPGLIAAVQRYVKTGGSSQKSVGAVRSLAPVALAAPLPFSWHAIPVSANGDYCVEKGAAVSIVRSRSGRATTVKIIDLKTKRRSQTAFEANQKSIPWPDEIELDPGATYAILVQGHQMRKLRLRLIAPLPAREDTLQVLHGQRCQSQFQAFIGQLQAKG